MEPIHDRVIIRPNKTEEKSPGGIIIPSAAQVKPLKGTITDVGPGKYSEQSGLLIPMQVKVGRVAIYPKNAGIEIEGEDEKLLIMKESDILLLE